MIKRIILFIESPLTPRDYQRFGISVLEKNGFSVEVWDFTAVLHPKVELAGAANFEFRGTRKFATKRDVIESLSGLGREHLIISWFQYLYGRLWIYRHISKNNILYAFMQLNAVPNMLNDIAGKVKMMRYMGYLFSLVNPKNWPKLKKYGRRFLSRILQFLPYRLLGIKPASIRFVGAERSLTNYKFPSDKNTKVIWLQAFDYDLFLENKKIEANQTAKKAVFLDLYLPFHEDNLLLDELPSVTLTRYYPSLCRFFDFVEEEQNVEIEIAAHPRSYYEKHPDYFGARNVIRGKTIDLVRKAKFVITHDSTALNFAILYYKPVIFIITEEMVRNNTTAMVYMMASLLGKGVINIDKPFSIGWDRELQVDKARYDSYKNAFIKKSGTQDLNSWQTVADIVKRF